MKIIQLILVLGMLFGQNCFSKSNEANKKVNIVFIGNSITEGAGIKDPIHDAPPAKVCEFLQKQPGLSDVKIANCGVSGCTTVDYLPATATLFPNAKNSADNFFKGKTALLIFSISLGTNDSAINGPNGSPVSSKQYQTNMKAIIDQLLALYPNCIVVVHRPLWYSPNTYNGSMYLVQGLNRLESYLAEIQTLVANYATTNPKQVWMGDCDAHDYFKANYLTDLIPEDGNAGTFYLHPNEKGAAVLAQFWGKAILKVALQ